MRYYSYDIWYFVDKFIDSAIEGNFMKWFFALFRKSFYLLWYLDWFILLLSSSKNFFFALIEEIFCWLPGKPFQLYFFVGENLLGVENSIWFGLAMNFLFCVWWVSALKPWKYIWRPLLKGSSYFRDKNSFESLQFLPYQAPIICWMSFSTNFKFTHVPF